VRRFILFLGVTGVTVVVFGVVGLGYGRISEAAMTSCGAIPRELRAQPSIVFTVEARRFPPWKFDCVYSRGDRVIARRHAAYP
jgi:hypothetical protein